MNEYVNAYMESKMEAQEYNCERVRENCYCEDANDDQACEQACYYQAGLDYCQQEEQNQNGQKQFNLQEALECRRLEVDDNAMQYYQYQNGNPNYQYMNNGQGGRMEFFVGPYCE